MNFKGHDIITEQNIFKQNIIIYRPSLPKVQLFCDVISTNVLMMANVMWRPSGVLILWESECDIECFIFHGRAAEGNV